MKQLMLSILLIFALASTAAADQCFVRLYNVTGSNVAFKLFDNAMQERPIEYGTLPNGQIVERYIYVGSNELRLEYKVAPATPTGEKPRLKVYEIPCGATVTIKK